MSHHKCKKLLFPLHPCQPLSVFFVIAILPGLRLNHNVVLTCISFVDTWNLFIFLHLSYFLWKGSVSSFAHFFIRSLILWEFSFLRSLCILVINTLSDVLAKILSHSVGCLFSVVTRSHNLNWGYWRKMWWQHYQEAISELSNSLSCTPRKIFILIYITSSKVVI
jgi:hypothetical protein